MWNPLGQIVQPGALASYAAPGGLNGAGSAAGTNSGRGGSPRRNGMFGNMERFGDFGAMFAMPESMAGQVADPRAYQHALRAWQQGAPFDRGDFRHAYNGWDRAGRPALSGYEPALAMQGQWNDWMAGMPSGF